MSESFEKWWATVPAEYTDVVSEDVARSAYTAGLLRAAEIINGAQFEGPNAAKHQKICESLAAAIRKEANDGKL